MNARTSYLSQDPQTTKTGQLMPIGTDLYNPGSWLKDGNSPAEIILATAILVSSIASLIIVLRAGKRR